jgi:Myo-inositol oxygenase
VASSDDWVRRAKGMVQGSLRRGGYELRRVPVDLPPEATQPQALPAMVEYWDGVLEIEQKHAAQTVEDVERLKKQYDQPVFGKVRVWKLVKQLAQCIDPSDGRLFGASQQVHVLQMLDAMARDHVDDPDLVLAALIHDTGKVLLLTDEDPANITCMNTPIGTYEAGVGLDNVTFQWGHDEFGYTRFVDLVPEHLAWLIRYHSIDVPTCEPLMDARDRQFYERYLRVFAYYDHETKTPFRLPSSRIADYRDIVEDAFPKPIRF